MADSGKGRPPNADGSRASSPRSSRERLQQDGEGRPGVETELKEGDDKRLTRSSGQNILSTNESGYDIKVNNKGEKSEEHQDHHQASSSQSSNNTGGKKVNKNEKGQIVAARKKEFLTEQTSTFQLQQYPKKTNKHRTQSSEMASKTEAPEIHNRRKNEEYPYLRGAFKQDMFGDDKDSKGGQMPKKNSNIHGHLKLQDPATSAAKSVEGEVLTESYVVLTLDGKYEVELNVKVTDGEDFKICAALSDTIETVMRKIEEKKQIPSQNQRLVVFGDVPLKTTTLLSAGVEMGSTIYLTVDKSNDANNVEESDNEFATLSQPNIPESNVNPQKNKEVVEMPTNLAESIVNSQQDETVRGNTPSQTESLDFVGLSQQDKEGFDVAVNPTGMSDTENNTQQEQTSNEMASCVTGSDNTLTNKAVCHDRKKTGKDERDQHVTSDSKPDVKSDFMKRFKEQKSTEDQAADPMEVKTEESDGGCPNTHEKDLNQVNEDKEEFTQSIDTVTESDVNGPIADEDKDMKVFVTTSRGDIAIDVKPNDYIKTIMAKLNEYSVDDIYLYWERKKLDNNQTLKDYNIQHNAKLIIMKDRKKGNKETRKSSLSEKSSDTLFTQHKESKLEGVDPKKDESDEDAEHFNNDLDVSTGYPITFTEGLVTDKTITEGSDLFLKCSVNKQDMSAKWYKDTELLSQGDRIRPISKELTHILQIQNVCQQDSGEYSVKIENLTSTSMVLVEERPLEVHLSLKRSLEAESGKDVVMTCIVSKQNRTANWTKDGKLINNNADKIIVESSEMWHQLTIKNVTMEDEGEYCLEIEDLQEKTILKVHDDNDGRDATQDYENVESPIHTQENAKSSSESFSKRDDDKEFDGNPSTDYKKKIRSSGIPKSEDLLVHLSQKQDVVGNASGPTGESVASKAPKQNPPRRNPSSNHFNRSVCESSPAHVSEDIDVEALTKEIDNMNLNKHEDKSGPDMIGSLQQAASSSGNQIIQGKDNKLGKAGSRSWLVKFKLSSDKQMKTRMTNIHHYMKYHYALNHDEYFKQVVSDLEKEEQIAISVKDGLLLIDESKSQRKTDNVNIVFEFIMRGIKRVVLNSWPTSGVDIKKVENVLMESELGLSKKIYVHCFEEFMYVTYDLSLEKEVYNDVEKAFKRFADKKCFSETRIGYIFRKILKNTDWKVQLKYKCPNVDVKWEVDDSEDVVKVVFTGNEEEVSEAMKLFEKDVVLENCCCSEKINYPDQDLFKQPEDVFLEYMRLKYENHADIVYDLNKKRKTVWLCSKTSMGEATTEIQALKKGGILKTFEMPFERQLLSERPIDDLKKVAHKSQYAVLQVVENRIVMKGLEKYVYELKQNVEEMIRNKEEANSAKGTNFIEYDSFLNHIEGNGVLKGLLERHEIQQPHFENENKKGIFYIGEETNCLNFFEELNRLKKRYVTQNVAVKLSKRMDIRKLDELLHIMEKDSNGQVKFQKCKATPSDNIRTSRVIGVTLEDDLRNCMYTQWCEDTYTVTVVEGSSDLISAEVVLVPVDEKSNHDLSQESVKKVAVLIPESKICVKNPKDAIEICIGTILADETQCVSVCIKSHILNGWKNYSYMKPLLYALMKFAGKSKVSRKDIVFSCSDNNAYDYCVKYCKDALKSKFETVKPINKDRYMNDFIVKVEKGGIVDFEVDVIVNTTNTDLGLSSGAVSKTILERAGPELQHEVSRIKPKGIQYGEIVETSSCQLKKAKIILHGALEKKDLQKLEEFVINCFKHADSNQYKSIALPAIGTGNLGFSKNDVAATMFKATKKFFRDNHPSDLRHILFVIYSKDFECLKVFKAQEDLWNKYLTYQASAFVYNEVRVQPNKGPILETLSDAVIYLYDDGKVHGSISAARNSVSAACGKNVFDQVSKQMREKEENIFRVKAENIKADMYFTRCHNSYDKIYSAVKQCLLEADKCKDIGALCIAFDKTHTFLLNTELANAICEAIKDVSHDIKHIKQVEVMIEGDQSFSDVFEYFKMEKRGLSKLNKPVRIEVSGFEEHVTKAVDKLCKQFSELPEQNENDVPQAEGGIAKEENVPKGSAKGNEYIEPSDTFAKYVEAHKIPAGLDKDTLIMKLFSTGKFPIPPPVVIYGRNNKKALLICQSERDAVKLSQCTDIEPFVFSCVKGKALSNITKTIDQDIVKKMTQDGNYDNFKKKLLLAKIKIKGESPFVLVAPTTFQFTFVKILIEELAHIEITSSLQVKSKTEITKNTPPHKESFSNIEIVQNVPENVWEVLRCSHQFREIKNKYTKDISYDKGTLMVELREDSSKNKLKTIEEIVEDFSKREWDEIQLEKEDYDKSLVKTWCNEMNKNMEYECCKYRDVDERIIVFAKNYEDKLKVKHFFKFKTGKIKPTGRGRRGKASSGENETKVDIHGYPEAQSRSPDWPDWKIDIKTLQEFSTKENISVYVYKADILNLHVDCIVNAANESLQHGGGVAAVIERAAGYNLTDESREYVRIYGKVPIGKACITTAGNLKYDCVIHAVGPRWSDYYPHSLNDVKDCERHLYQAVYNSFLEAEKRGLKSIALPAISSAIFGVPEELCVYQYAKATLEYSRKTTDQPSALKEIHFIDRNKDIVKKIQDAFYTVFVKGDISYYDSNKFVKTKYRKQSPENHAGVQASAGSSVHRFSPNKQSQSSSKAVYEAKQVEPLSFFDDVFSAYAYHLHGDEKHKLLISRGDMFKVKAKAVVIPVDDQGRRGNIASSLISKIPKVYLTDYNRKVSSECHNSRLCDVFIVPGYECGYTFILHAVYPAIAKNKSISQRKDDVRKLYDNIFSTCDSQDCIHALVTTLLGADMRSAEDIKTCAEMFLQSYLNFYSKPVMKRDLRVHLVCKDDLVYESVKHVLDDYVKARKSELNENQKDNDISQNAPTDDVKQKNLETDEEENCVICMDTVTDPETLKCGHTFCKECIQAQFNFKEACPTCGQVCGIITGDQPDGDMSIYVEKYSYCSGYEGCGRIAITYNFPSGRQGPNHPSPGTFYKGITRIAYLPNNAEGRKILALLKVAFKRKLVFTIGNSRTTGQEGVITWNDIHHKTNPRPHQQFGYPDPGYLERVKDELAVKGVTENDIPK